MPEKHSCLVPRSRSLDSIIAHHLHQPSFATDSRNPEDTADRSNGCIAMVMGKAFQEGETLLFDHLHRRSVKSEGSSIKDIEFAFERCVDVKGVEKQNVHGERGRQLRYMLHQLMLKQQHHLVSQASANDDLLFNRVDGSTVETVRSCGALKTVDGSPRFTCARAGGYVMRTTRRCKSEQ